jgi:Uma2 family endonuclease
MVSLERLRPITRREYERMGEAGLFQGERIELIGGVLLAMSPIGVRHNHVVAILNRMLVLALRERAWVAIQSSYALDDLSEPEPDVAVLPPDGFAGPDLPSSALLLIEVAESSLAHDRGKAGRYAASGLAEYWIVNLVDEVIEVHRQPQAGRYADVRIARPGDQLPLLAFPEVVLDAAAILVR